MYRIILPRAKHVNGEPIPYTAWGARVDREARQQRKKRETEFKLALQVAIYCTTLHMYQQLLILSRNSKSCAKSKM
jgi:hypothetical protein